MSIFTESCTNCGSHPVFEPTKDCERCKLIWTLSKVVDLREAQVAFFTTKLPEHLIQSKELERIVDKALRRLDGQEVQEELF